MGIDADSANKVMDGSQQALVYGYTHCMYMQVSDALKRSSPSRKIFDYKLGDRKTLPKRITTLEGRKIEQLDFGPEETRRSQFKNGLVNLVLENYKREKEGLPLIPILFCTDIDHSPYPVSAEIITSKNNEFNSLITHSELRRAYKLCYEFDDEAFKKIALKSFRFIKLKEAANAPKYLLEQIKAPWDSPDWKNLWVSRKKTSQNSTKQISWKSQLQASIQSYNKQSKDASSAQQCSS